MVGFQSGGEDTGCNVEGIESTVGRAARRLGIHSGEPNPLAWISQRAMEEQTLGTLEDKVSTRKIFTWKEA